MAAGAGPRLHLSLSDLDVRAFDVFVLSSGAFWAGGRRGNNHSQPHIVAEFFDTLRELGEPGSSRGFIVAREASVCSSAASVVAPRTSVPCVVTREADDGDDLSWWQIQRWRVLQHFLERGRRIACAGADVRFLRPLPRLYDELGALGADVSLEGDVDIRTRRIRAFTPDLVAVMPTPPALHLVRRMIAALRLYGADRLAGLPAEVQQQAGYLRGRDLGGPGQQVVVHDALLSLLHNRTISTHRHQQVSIQHGIQMRLAGTQAAVAGSASTAPSARAGATAPLQQGGREGGVPKPPPLEPLPGTVEERPPLGTVVRTPHLVALLSHTQGFAVTHPSPCSPICIGNVANAFALHCIGKRAPCLELRGCALCRAGKRSREDSS